MFVSSPSGILNSPISSVFSLTEVVPSESILLIMYALFDEEESSLKKAYTLNEAKEIASCSKFIKKHIPEELLNFYIKVNEYLYIFKNMVVYFSNEKHWK